MNSLLQEEYALMQEDECTEHENTPQYMPTFDEFWNLYGYKVGGPKKARTAWNKLSFVDHNLIMNHLPERLETDELWLKGIGKPYPTTFLNQERWLDEYTKKRERHSQGSEPESIVSRLQRT